MRYQLLFSLVQVIGLYLTIVSSRPVPVDGEGDVDTRDLALYDELLTLRDVNEYLALSLRDVLQDGLQDIEVRGPPSSRWLTVAQNLPKIAKQYGQVQNLPNRDAKYISQEGLKFKGKDVRTAAFNSLLYAKKRAGKYPARFRNYPNSGDGSKPLPNMPEAPKGAKTFEYPVTVDKHGYHKGSPGGIRAVFRKVKNAIAFQGAVGHPSIHSGDHHEIKPKK